MNNNAYNDEIEINLIGVTWEILLRWKLLFIIGIFAGFIVVGVKYYTIPVSQNVVTTDGVEQDINERISQLEAEMDATGNADDITTVNMLLFRSQSLHKIREVCASSAITQFDAYNTRKLTITYRSISDDSISDLYSIKNITTSTDFLSLISEINAINKDDPYLYVLVEANVYESNSEKELKNILSVSIIITDAVDAVDAEDAVDAVTDYLYDYVLYNDKKVSNLIRISDYSLFTGYNAVIKTTQDSITKQYNNISIESSAINTEMDKLSDAGKELLQLKLANGGINYDGTKNNSDDVSVVNDVPVQQRSFSVKYLIIGFVGGIFAYICILLIKIIFFPKLGYTLESPLISSYPTFGSLVDKSYRRGNSFIFSPMVYKLMHRKDMDTDTSINDIVSAMEYYGDAEHKDMITPVSVGALSEKADELFSKVVDKWADKYNAELPVIDLLTTNADKSKLYEKISSINGEIVLILENNRTNLRDVENVVAMLSEKGVKIIGKVMIG